ncbi:MAG TPA: CheR family methyltransferase, partial [Candidatus Obscuribacterales bacterium]
KENLVFSQHNLATDGSFNEFNVILCRNVLIYFNNALQDRVHKLLYESLGRFGILGLGQQESLSLTKYEDCYEELESREKLYRRIK